jgi:hypothetical protein
MESMAPNAVALCRCGGPTTESFCNGTHTKVGFRAAQRAVRKEGGRCDQVSHPTGCPGEPSDSLWNLRDVCLRHTRAQRTRGVHLKTRSV